jgi:hypothetical protein
MRKSVTLEKQESRIRQKNVKISSIAVPHALPCRNDLHGRFSAVNVADNSIAGHIDAA